MTAKLPNAREAYVESEKITDYLLSLDHPEGKGKAKFFMEHGFKVNHHGELAASLRKHAATQPVTDRKDSEYGVKYIIECECHSPDGRNPCIRSVWIVETGETAPRLVTAHPTKN